jgi:hypothetical protein
VGCLAIGQAREGGCPLVEGEQPVAVGVEATHERVHVSLMHGVGRAARARRPLRLQLQPREPRSQLGAREQPCSRVGLGSGSAVSGKG